MKNEAAGLVEARGIVLSTPGFAAPFQPDRNGLPSRESIQLKAAAREQAVISIGRDEGSVNGAILVPQFCGSAVVRLIFTLKGHLKISEWEASGSRLLRRRTFGRGAEPE